MFRPFYFLWLIMVLRVATINVQGLRDSKKRLGVFTSLQRSGFDVIALQETHSDASVIEQWQREWSGLSCWSAASSTSAGVGILFSDRLPISVRHEVTDSDGRLIRVTVEISDSVLQIANVYGPNPCRLSDSNHFFHKLDSYLDPRLPLIILGDFNMVEKPFQDRDGGNVRNPQHVWGIQTLKPLLTRHHLVDVWRSHHPNFRSFTWHCRYNSIKSRLDRIYIPTSYLPHASTSYINHFVWSDHDVCAVELTLPTQQVRGKGYWKLNLQFLQHPLYCDQIRAFWTDWQTKHDLFDSDLMWWDCGKSYIKAISIEYAKQLHCDLKTKKYDLLASLRRERTQPVPDVVRLRTLEDELFQLENELNAKLFIHTHTHRGPREARNTK